MSSTVIGPGEAVVIPPESQEVDWEVELGVVIGKRGRRIAVESALEHVAGYTVVNDISARDLTRRSDYPFSSMGSRARTSTLFVLWDLGSCPEARSRIRKSFGSDDVIVDVFERGCYTPDELKSLGVPILFAVGELDVLVPPKLVNELAGMMAGSFAVEFSDSGHSPYFEKPTEFNDSVLSFLQAVGVKGNDGKDALSNAPGYRKVQS
jgi:pimeloyl-ACP methyl ester carboxylesterase